jgi:hypothetical protein
MSPPVATKACLAGQPSHVILILHSHTKTETLHAEGLGFYQGEVTLWFLIHDWTLWYGV